MNITKLLLASFLTVFILAFSFSQQVLADENQSLQKVRLQLNWKHEFQFAGYYAAIEKGFYADKGLDVELVDFTHNINVIDEVVSGRADYAISSMEILIERLNGSPITLLANYFKRYPRVIIAQKSISNLSQLKGKRFMTTQAALKSPILRSIFKNVGLDPEKDMTIVPHSFSVEPFVNNEIDVMTAYVSTEPFQLDEQGKPYNSLNFSTFLPTLSESFLFTSDNKANSDTQQARDFVEATNQGWAYALAHKQEMIDLISTKRLVKVTQAAMMFEAEQTEALIMADAFPIGSVSADNLRLSAEILLKTGEVKNIQRLDGFLLFPSIKNNAFSKKDLLTKAEQQWLQQHPDIVLGFSSSFPPFLIQDENGKVTGFIPDYIDLLNQHLGTQITLKVTSTMVELGKKAALGEIDGIAVVHPVKKWTEKLKFTDTFVKTQQYLFVRNESKLTGVQLTDLKGKSVGYLKGVAVSEQLLAQHPEITVVVYDSHKTMVNGLLAGEVDALLGHIHLEYWRRRHTQLTFHLASIVDSSIEDLVIAIRKDWPELIPILNKGIASIGKDKANQLLTQWLGDIKTQLEQQTFEKPDTLWNLLISVVLLFIVLLIILYFIAPCLFSEKKLARYFDSVLFRVSILFGLSLIVVLSSLLVWNMLAENRKNTLAFVHKKLESNLQMTLKHLNFFERERKNYLLQLGRDTELVKITEALLDLSATDKILKNSIPLQQARDYFAKRKFEFNHQGFFIISPKNINLASQHDRNIGTQNFIGLQEPERIKQVFQGVPAFIPPLRSDVALDSQKTEYPQTFFFAAPITNSRGHVIAVLTQRLLPHQVLSQLKAYENNNMDLSNYIVDKNGLMLNKSHFKQQLIQLGLLSKDSTYQQIEIRSPKGNLLEGYQPITAFKEWSFTHMAQAIINLSSQTNVKENQIFVDMTGYRDYRGVLVYGAWMWSQTLGIGISAEIGVKEAMQEHRYLRDKLLVIMGMTLLLSVIATLLVVMFGQRMARSLNNARHVLEEEVALRTQELKKLTVAVEQSPASIVITDLDLNIQYVNPCFSKTTGYRADEVLGKKINIISSGMTPRKSYNDLWKALNQGETWHGEFINKRKNHEIYWEKTTIAPIRNEQNLVDHYVAIKEDITALKRSEERNTRLGRILEDSLNEIYVFDAKTLRFTQVNKGARQNLNYSMDELRKLTPVDIKPDFSLEGFLKELEPLVEGKEDFIVFQTRHQRKDGSTYPVEVYLQFPQAEFSSVFVAIIQDISERNKAEVLLKQAKIDAEKASTAKSLFIANMSHELRTPLNAILGFSQIMAESENLTEKQQQNLKIINSSGEHLLGLINDVLDISKIEAGKVELYPTNFNLGDFLNDLENIFKTLLNKKSLSFVCNYQQDLPQMIYMDKTKLRQILVNLINNAIKFTDTGGITVRVGHRKVSENQLRLYFEVEDTGYGIAEDELDKVFTKFSQTESGLKSEKGTGLGLSISQQFVNLMEGEISLESQLNKGTVFKFNVLINETDQPTQSIKNTPNIIGLVPEKTVHRILIVDDSEINRLILIELLSPLGFELKEAEGGRQAIELWKSWQPNLTLMDINMPDIDGYEATRQIKSLSRDAVIIAITTATAFENKKEAVLEAGCNDIVTKPFEHAVLFGKIQKYLKVQYLYQEKIETVEKTPVAICIIKEAIAELPHELQEQLKRAISIVDTDEIEKLLHQVGQENQYLANEIKRYMDDFQYDLLLSLFG